MRVLAPVIATLLTACSSPALEPTRDVDPKALVRLSLRADRTALAPGSDATLAAHFAIADGWHIYWQNPGDAGLPTEATIASPGGFEIDGPRYPAPIRFVSPGDIVSYGYEREAALLFTVSAPSDPAGAARFVVDAEWLACRERCIRGKGSAELELPIGAGAATDRLARFSARLPRPAAELDAQLEWRLRTGGASATVQVPGADELAFFPYADPVPPLQSARHTGGQLELDFRPRAETSDVRGVLMVTRNPTTRWYQVRWPWPG